ncbi:MAG: hypothetical protein KDK78_02950, partial [Chlamydiia bacterium]|nr:hypothetical protein [Chlamydiia bacterium]
MKMAKVLNKALCLSLCAMSCVVQAGGESTLNSSRPPHIPVLLAFKKVLRDSFEDHGFTVVNCGAAAMEDIEFVIIDLSIRGYADVATAREMASSAREHAIALGVGNQDLDHYLRHPPIGRKTFVISINFSDDNGKSPQGYISQVNVGYSSYHYIIHSMEPRLLSRTLHEEPYADVEKLGPPRPLAELVKALLRTVASAPPRVWMDDEYETISWSNGWHDGKMLVNSR